MCAICQLRRLGGRRKTRKAVAELARKAAQPPLPTDLALMSLPIPLRVTAVVLAPGSASGQPCSGPPFRRWRCWRNPPLPLPQIARCGAP